MAALLDLHPEGTSPVLSGVAEIEAVLDRMLAGTTSRWSQASYGAAVAALDRASRRLEALKLKLVAAADKAGVAKDAGFTGADAWLAKTTTVSRADAARQVALAAELDSGHDATAEALDAGLVSPEHAAVIVRATGQLPDRRERRAAPGRGDSAGGEGGPVQSRPAPPHRPPRDRGRRTRPEDRGRPRERAHPHRGASRPGEVLADACTTTATAPPPDTSPSPPWPQRCSARSSTR